MYDSTRYLGHVNKVNLIKGNAIETIPFIEENPHVLVSLLYWTLICTNLLKLLESFLPRMPKGAILAFDELDNPCGQGNPRHLESHAERPLKIER